MRNDTNTSMDNTSATSATSGESDAKYISLFEEPEDEFEEFKPYDRKVNKGDTNEAQLPRDADDWETDWDLSTWQSNSKDDFGTLLKNEILKMRDEKE